MVYVGVGGVFLAVTGKVLLLFEATGWYFDYVITIFILTKRKINPDL